MELPIPGFKNYLATTDGHIIRLRTGRWMRPAVSSNGYLNLPLIHDNGARCQVTVHRMIARTFLPASSDISWGKGRTPNILVRHLNDDKLDNRAVNLAWGTQADNARDAIRNGTIYSTPILDTSMQSACRRRHSEGERAISLAAEFGVSITTIHRYIRGRR